MTICNKIPYPTPRAAKAAAFALNRRGWALGSVHACAVHHAWHVSRQRSTGHNGFSMRLPSKTNVKVASR